MAESIGNYVLIAAEYMGFDPRMRMHEAIRLENGMRHTLMFLNDLGMRGIEKYVIEHHHKKLVGNTKNN